MTTKSATRDQMKKSFSRKLMAARLSAGISQLRLAQMSGISNSTISNYEVGKTFPDDTNMKKIVKALPTLAGKEAPGPSGAKAKESVIEVAAVSTNDARLAFMRSLVRTAAAPDMKHLFESAERAKISQKETFDMLSVLLDG